MKKQSVEGIVVPFTMIDIFLFFFPIALPYYKDVWRRLCICLNLEGFLRGNYKKLTATCVSTFHAQYEGTRLSCCSVVALGWNDLAGTRGLRLLWSPGLSWGSLCGCAGTPQLPAATMGRDLGLAVTVPGGAVGLPGSLLMGHTGRLPWQCKVLDVTHSDPVG